MSVGNPEIDASVGKSAAVYAVGTALSRILGLLRDIMIARYFSVDIRDAFVNAFRLPNVFRRILGEGALSASFIPIFIEARAGLNETEAVLRTKKLVSGVFSILLAFVTTLSGLAILFMEDFLRALLAGSAYMQVPGKFALTVQLARILFSFLIFISLFAYFAAVLNSLRRFALSALAPCLFNITIILAAYFMARENGNPYGLAWAVLLGGFVQMAVVAVGVWRAGCFPTLTSEWGQPDLLRVLKRVGPSVLGLSVLQLNTIVNMRFASDLPAGSHSYLYLADRIFELPLSLFVVSIGAALLPALSKNWVDGNRQAMGKTINHYIRLIIFVSLPAAVGMFILAQPISEVLFLGREFTYDDAYKTSQIIQIYSFGLIIAAGVRMLAQGFYAIQNVWFPAGAAVVALFSHIILAFALTRVFGLNGLAASSVLSGGINLLMLGFAYNGWVGSLEFRNLILSLLKFIFCVLVMILILQIYGPLQKLVGTARPGSRAAVLLITIALGGVGYLVSAVLLRTEEFRFTVATFIKGRSR